MKKCPYCGKRYPDTAVQCAIDHEPLQPPEPLQIQQETAWRPQLIDLGRVEGAFTFEEGFSRPDWERIRSAIKSTVIQDRLSAAWTEAAMQWVEEVRGDLGGDYRVDWSTEFILLSSLEPPDAGQLLAFAEKTLDEIQKAIGDAAWTSGCGKRVILLFADTDDYYQYASYFHKEGVHPASGGCLIHSGYVHVAMPYRDGRRIRSTLVHELTHNSVVQLPLPLWVNEGLAVTVQRKALTFQPPILDHELRDRHLAFWNSENIQKFWAGLSFREPGDSNELSYNLAEILLKLLVGESGNLVDFLKYANRSDAGQTAALDCYGTDLGVLAATFLGEGDWRPSRKAIVACWNAAKPPDECRPPFP